MTDEGWTVAETKGFLQYFPYRTKKQHPFIFQRFFYFNIIINDGIFIKMFTRKK